MEPLPQGDYEEALRRAEARFEKKRNFWNKTKLLRNGWTPELIKELLGEPDEINNFYTRYGKGEEHLYRADRVRQAQRLPAFREWQAKRMQPLPRSEAKRKALAERVDAFLERAGLGLDDRQTEILRTIFPALEKQAECPTFDPAVIVLFPKWGPIDNEWLSVLYILAEQGYVEVKGGLKRGWSKSPILRVDLTGPVQHEELHADNPDPDFAFAL